MLEWFVIMPAVDHANKLISVSMYIWYLEKYM